MAAKVFALLEEAFERLARNPGIGHRREDFGRDDSVRFWTVGASFVAYRIADGVTEILFVERGEYDWATLLGEESD